VARRAPTGWSASNFLTRSGFIRDGDAFLVNVWVKGPHNATVHVWSQGQNGTLNHRRTLRIPGSPRASAQVQTTGGAAVSTNTGLSTSTWGPVAARFDTTTSRTAYHTAGNKATPNTTSVSPATPDQLRVGLSHAGDSAFFSTGGIAEVSVWDTTGMTDGEIDSLVTGQLQDVSGGTAANPLIINAQTGQPWEGTLLAYWPLDINAADPWDDASGNGHDLSMTGTLTDEGTFPPVDSADVSVSLGGGTVIGDGDPRLESDIVAGGRTMVLTLTNTTWVAAGATFDAQRQNIIDGLVSATNPTNGWNNEVAPLIDVADVVRTSNTVVTITLPAVPSYGLTTASETVTVTIPGSAIASGLAEVAAETLTIHPEIATARRATAGWSVPNVPNPVGNFLTGPAFVTGDGFLVSQWIKQTEWRKTMPWQLGKAGVLSHHWRLIISTDGECYVGKWWNPTGETESDPGFDDAQDHTGHQAQPVSILAPINRWFSFIGAWLANSEKHIWLHGNMDEEGFDDTAATPNTPTSTRIGVRMDDADGFQAVDETAEVSVWDVSAMTLTEIRALVVALSRLTDGLVPNPLTINAQVGEAWAGKLLSYPDLDFTSPTWAQDRSDNGVDYTEVGTLTEGSSYPPVAEYSAPADPEPTGRRLVMAGGL
jgi:hypothetical protein